MRIVFFGSGAFGLASFQALVSAGHTPVLVVTQPPRRRRRNKPPEPTPVQLAATALGVDVITPPSVNKPDALDALRGANAQLFVVAEFGQILSQALLDIPPLGSINMHTSLLPRWRGASPVVAAIRAGDAETGVSIQRVVQKLDAGPVLAERRIAIEAEENAGELSRRMAPLGGELLAEVVAAFARGAPPPDRPQDEAAVTLCKRLAPEDGEIDWSRPADELARLVRAMTPKPGARTRRGGTELQIRRARSVGGEAEPGVVAAIAPDGFDVGCGAGLLRVLELVPASRKPMAARDFVNGYRLSVGERLG
ncbi:MAG: methionyl-tRNA formyltransferase [Planctomycetota bacterium]